MPKNMFVRNAPVDKKNETVAGIPFPRQGTLVVKEMRKYS